MLDFLRTLLEPAPSPPAASVHEMPAFRELRRYNPHGLIGVERGVFCMLEDHTDPDNRMFRIEYQSTPDGRHAIAWCRHNPWGGLSEIHTTNNGLICIGPEGHHTHPRQSPYNLDFVVPRARLWCTCVSVYHETGQWPA